MTTDDELEAVWALELRLLDPEVRRRPADVDRLLHPDFVEIGASGRIWDRQAILQALANEDGQSLEVSDVDVQALAPGVVLITYRTGEPAPSLRASVWVKDAGDWRVRFHQGTPAAR